LLQNTLGLPDAPRIPILAVITRLVPQKGTELLVGAIPEIVENQDVQFVLLGTGDSKSEGFFKRLGTRFPHKVVGRFGFDLYMSHLIQAGADIFLMPSQFEPCGLTQMFALRYGTVPVVRRTGGLADTVADAGKRGGTGFVFDDFHEHAFEEAVLRAIKCYSSDPRTWESLVRRGMSRRFSWEESASRYLESMANLLGGWSGPGSSRDMKG
jgi:starch synthase